MDVVVPFDVVTPKTRLAPVLSDTERRSFAAAMVTDVLTAIREAGHSPHVVATAPIDRDLPTTVDDRPLTEAVNAVLADRSPTPTEPVAVHMADLPLVTPTTIDRLLTPPENDSAPRAGDTPTRTADTPAQTTETSEQTDSPVQTAETPEQTDSPAGVTIAPGLGGGTNALVVRTPDFRVDYHGASCRDHERIAADCGARVRTIDSRRLAVDIDEPADLAELLLHGDGHARDWLCDHGFQLDTGDGRVSVERVE